jgi:hypothetical protein
VVCRALATVLALAQELRFESAGAQCYDDEEKKSLVMSTLQ